MSRYVDIDQIIADIHEKWGCDPAYIANDTPTGIEARRDAYLIELLQSKLHINIVKCMECEFYRRGSCVHIKGLVGSVNLDSYCSYGERRRHNG